MDVKDYLKHEKQLTDSALSEFFSSQNQYISSQVHPSLNLVWQELERLVLRGGKRLRPLLTRLSYQLVAGSDGKPNFDLVKVSVYPELLHAYLLIHDDIADRDYQRYGGPTMEVTFNQLYQQKHGKTWPHFGLSLALISGDLLHTLARKTLQEAKLSAPQILMVEDLVTGTMAQVAAGWNLHLWQNHQSLPEADTDEYLAGMELVSGSYTVAGPINIGLCLAGAGDDTKALMASYAQHVGLAFQMQDDILGVFGDSKMTGKPVGNDLREGKKTLLVLKAYELGDKHQRQALEQLLGTDLSGDQTRELQQIITDSGALDLAQKSALDHARQAQKDLSYLSPNLDQDAVTKFAHLAEFVVARHK